MHAPPHIRGRQRTTCSSQFYVGPRNQIWVIRHGSRHFNQGSCLADLHLGFFCVHTYIHLSWLDLSSSLSRWAMRAEHCLHYCPAAFAEPCGVLGRMETVFSINTFMRLKITASYRIYLDNWILWSLFIQYHWKAFVLYPLALMLPSSNSLGPSDLLFAGIHCVKFSAQYEKFCRDLACSLL